MVGRSGRKGRQPLPSLIVVVAVAGAGVVALLAKQGVCKRAFTSDDGSGLVFFIFVKNKVNRVILTCLPSKSIQNKMKNNCLFIYM